MLLEMSFFNCNDSGPSENEYIDLKRNARPQKVRMSEKLSLIRSSSTFRRALSSSSLSSLSLLFSSLFRSSRLTSYPHIGGSLRAEDGKLRQQPRKENGGKRGFFRGSVEDSDLHPEVRERRREKSRRRNRETDRVPFFGGLFF